MDKEAVRERLFEDYRRSRPKSEAFFSRACRVQVSGGSHNIRLFAPFPFYDVSSSGSRVIDLDGHTYVDFWQGHFSNVLGHNPPVVIEALGSWFREGQGLITGFPGTFQHELAELILSRIHADKIRFTTSGSLAAMYAMMLARAFTRRELVMKVGGGWHGAQPYALKGVSTYDHGLDRVESAGLPASVDAMIVTTRFNDPDDLRRKFTAYGDRTACFIVEPMVGSGGLIVAEEAYLREAQDLTRKHGTLLIIDEVITGFRFHAGGAHLLYGLEPDLVVLGKCIGGGMPLSAVAGRADVMALAGPGAPAESRVKFDGGTFSAHPACMLAGLTFLRHLVKHEDEIYPRIGRLGAKVRKGLEGVFQSCGFNVLCTGAGGPIGEQSSFVGVHFLKAGLKEVNSPEEAWNPAVSDHDLREKIFKLAMLLEGFHVFHGYGSITAAHTEEEIQGSLAAAASVARKWCE